MFLFITLWFAVFAGIFLTLGYLKKYQGKIYPHASFYGADLGGKTQEESLVLIRKKSADLENKELLLVKEGNTISASLSELGVNLETETVSQNAFSIGRKGNLLSKLKEIIQSRFLSLPVEISFSLDKGKFERFTLENLNQDELLARPAEIVYLENKFVVNPPQDGFGIDKLNLLEKIALYLSQSEGKNSLAVSVLSNKTPSVTKEEAIPAAEKANLLIAKTYRLSAGEKTWEMSQEFLVKMLDFKTPTEEKNQEKKEILTPKTFANSATYHFFSKQNKKQAPETIEVFLKEKEVLDYLSTIAPGIEQASVSAILGFTDNQLKVVSPGQNEIKLNIPESAKYLTVKILAGEENISFPVVSMPATVSESNLNTLGLKTLLAQGESNFVGSPQNRKHNIATGAARFNGVLIKPGEEFSFIERLGPVDKSTGYLPELVIKENKTIPEYGGGMCQVSTTAFRGAVNAGLAITERRNHAYPVQYYAPQGTDATVYIPNPDLKFKNNTPAHIYIQTRIEGTKLFFEYYGTNDGRIVKTEGPITYDRTGDGGMRAKWIQKVYNPDGSLLFEDTFLSKYDSPNKYPHPGQEPQPVEKKKKKKH